LQAVRRVLETGAGRRESALFSNRSYRASGQEEEDEELEDSGVVE
jgi:hypothetical protein